MFVRPEVFAGVLPHEAAAAASFAPDHSPEELRVEDVFAVMEELRRPARSHGAWADTTAYSTWVAAAWHVLAWPEPSARLLWEMVWLLGEDRAGEALSERLPSSDLGLFLLLHCRHESSPAALFEESWIAGGPSPPSLKEDSDTDSVESGCHSQPETPPASPPTSPRSARGVKRASIDLCLRARAAAEASRLDWVCARLESMLQLVSDQRQLSCAEFDRLGFLLRPRGASTLSGSCGSLFASSGRASIDELQHWLARCLGHDYEPPLFAGRLNDGETQPTRSTWSDATQQTIVVADARRCTRVVSGDDGGLRDCRIVGCRDTRVYVLASARYADVVGCVDCLIVLGAVSKIARLVACERTHVVVAAGRAIVSSCLSCRLSLYSPVPPLFDGDNRSCRVGPYCAAYDGLKDHLVTAGLLIPPEEESDDLWHAAPNLWKAPLRLAATLAKGANFARPPSSAESLTLAPADFEVIAAPFARAEPVIPFMLPAEYAAALTARRDRALDLRRRIAHARLPPNERAKLEDATRAAFAKWLVDSRNLRHVLDFMHLDVIRCGPDNHDDTL